MVFALPTNMSTRGSYIIVQDDFQEDMPNIFKGSYLRN